MRKALLVKMRRLQALLMIVSTISCGAAAFATDIPHPNLTLAETQVKEKVEQSRAVVERAPDSAEAWGRYGMVLDAHGMSFEARLAYEEAAKLAPNDFRWPYYLGHTYMRTKPEEARRHFQTALTLRPAYPPIHICLGQVLDMLGESEAAWERYERAAALAPNNPWARMNFGQAALDRGRLDVAATELHAADEQAPDYGVILTLLAKLYARLGDQEKAAMYGQRATEHVGKVLMYDPVHKAMTDEAVSLSMFKRRASIFIDAGMLDEAIAEYRRALEYVPSDIDLLAGLLDVLLQSDQYEEALAEATRSLEAGVESAHVRRAHAIALCQLRRYEEAERSALEALERYPELVQMQQVLGYACAARGEIEAAIDYLDQSLEAAPDDKDTRLGLARILAGEGRYEEASSHLALIAKGMAGDPQYSRVLGMVHLGQGRYKEAVEALDVTLKHTPMDGPALRLLASALVSMGRYAEAEERLRQFWSKQRQAVFVANDLAWLLATCPEENVRDGEEALEIAEEICRIPQARSPATLDTLAAAYAEAGRFDDAVRTMDEAITLAKKNAIDADRLESFEERRALYAESKPYRTEPVDDGGSPGS